MTRSHEPKILELLPPQRQLSPAIAKSIENLLDTLRQDPTKQHLLNNANKGRAQIQAFMTKMHSDANGVPFSTFDAFVKRHSESWTNHVKDAEKMNDKAQIDKRKLLAPSLGQHKLSGIDIRVGKGRAPDDKVYQESDYARNHMPRGNFLLSYPSLAIDSGEVIVHYFPVIRGYPKFTGQEDDHHVKENIASEFFSKPIEKAKHVVVTRKENGEAAHLAVLKTIQNEYIFAIGSKNTHFLVSNMEEIKVACCQDISECRAYRAALPLGTAILQMIENLAQESREMLCEFLWQTQTTACFEVLCPSHQHVEPLDHLLTDTPLFYALSFPDLEPSAGTKIAMNPVLPFLFMELCEVQTVPFYMIDFDVANRHILTDSVRSAHGFEGVVNIFLDDELNVIGIEKVKTNWYVCLRAIREKAKTFWGKFCEEEKRKKELIDKAAGDASKRVENHVSTSEEAKDVSDRVEKKDLLSETAKNISNRIRNIQRFTKMSDEMCHTFQRLGKEFIEYIHSNGVAEERKIGLRHSLADHFPIVWKKFLQDTGNREAIKILI
uniref:Uncharacterized protein AlNc14C555G12147 n=1 Tax=Albugo laibachii Nc14 TaxID=890382 RepID=F0X154_9STRA|nr:conserved hypothetical protein [Albugo laibachii Nc14]|eukprot:CCA27510.1 conserved hypothetical protein [Albugo laibachii Nc14]